MPRQCIQQQWLDRVPGGLGTEGAGAIGVDEAGRGPWAGPVFAAAVHVPLDVAIPGVQDSKKMSEKQREEVYRLLTTNHSITYASASVSAKRIDEINILQATFEAMSAAVKKVRDSLKQKKNVVVLIDGPKVPPAIQAACQTARGTRAEAVIGGDHKRSLRKDAPQRRRLFLDKIGDFFDNLGEDLVEGVKNLLSGALATVDDIKDYWEGIVDTVTKAIRGEDAKFDKTLNLFNLNFDTVKHSNSRWST